MSLRVHSLAVPAVALLGVARGRDDRLGIAVLGSSMARMLVALTIGVGVMTIGNVEGRSFLTVFLCSGLLALGAETVWAMKRSAAMSVETRPPSAATGGTPAGAR